MRLTRIVTAEPPAFERLEAVHLRVLFEQDDMRTRHDCTLPLVRIDQIRQTLEESGLAGAVTADQSQAITLPDVQVQAAEQPAFALNEAKVFVTEDRRS